MYAIIETGGKQYKVTSGDVIYVEKLNADVDAEVEFDVLVYADGENVTVGTPAVNGMKATGKVLRQGKSSKIIVFKHKPKKDYRRKQGHRQPFTKVEILRIG